MYQHRYGVFVRLELSTGLRIGELLALRWKDIVVPKNSVLILLKAA